MSWMWFARVDGGIASEAFAAAAIVAGEGAGDYLAVWPSSYRPKVPATKIDARIVDLGGEGAEVSLVLAPARVRLPFDDTAVQQARRVVLAGPPARAVSALLRGESIFAGAVTVDPRIDDPFARIFTAVRLTIGPGLFGSVPAPPGPDIERHGSGAPWPYPSFD